MVTGSGIGAARSCSAGSAARQKLAAGVSGLRPPRDAEPGEQQQAEPADLVDQRRAPDDAASAAVQHAGEMVQLAQLPRAFEGLGFEVAFRSALASAKARCRRQPIAEPTPEEERRISPGQQVGGDQQRNRQRDGQAQPQEKTHQRFFRRAEDDLRQRELLRIARGRRLQRKAEHLVAQGQAVGNDETGDEEHRSRRRGPRQKHRDEGHYCHQRNPQRRLRQAEHEDRDRHENR